MVFVPPGHLATLFSPWWGQYGYTVLLVPSLPLLYAFSPCIFVSSSPSSPSLLGFALSLCAWLASSSTSLLASPTFFPSVASLGILSGSPLLATLCSLLSFYLILLSSSPPSSFSFPSSSLPRLFPASKGVCPKRLCPTWQHLTNLWPLLAKMRLVSSWLMGKRSCAN